MIAGIALLSLPAFDDYSFEYRHSEKTSKTRENFTFIFIFMIPSIYFLVELIMRFIFSPHKGYFFLNTVTFIDCLSLVGCLFLLADREMMFHDTLAMNPTTLVTLRMLKLFWFARHWPAVQGMWYVLKSSLQAIFFIFLLYFVFAFIFAAEVYADEADSEYSHFRSIPGAMWWAIITMTTVGYGDITPVTFKGKTTGIICAITGVFIYAMVGSIIIHKYITYKSDTRYERQGTKSDCSNLKCCEKSQ